VAACPASPGSTSHRGRNLPCGFGGIAQLRTGVAPAAETGRPDPRPDWERRNSGYRPAGTATGLDGTAPDPDWTENWHAIARPAHRSRAGARTTTPSAGWPSELRQQGGLQLRLVKHSIEPAMRRGQPLQQAGRAASDAHIAQSKPAAQRSVE